MGCSRPEGAGVRSPWEAAGHRQLWQGKCDTFSEPALQPDSLTAVVLRARAAARSAELQQVGGTEVGSCQSWTFLASCIAETACVAHSIASRIAETSLIPCEPAFFTDIAATWETVAVSMASGLGSPAASSGQ
mmetsp:Transcript_154041/g.266796  ORF Transcript_154041/g.266796 Transcript_154041/m.266796 type:complete len:133 (-) Transcript_154041:1911-2309(-)